MNLRPIQLFALLFIVITATGCKFYFNESEYLGTYYGDFTTEVTAYKSCSGQLVLTDVGDNLVDMELITDSNATLYFTNIKIERGYSLGSSSLNFVDPGTYGVDGAVSRTTHYLYFSYYTSPTYSDYSFKGTRQ